MLERYKGNPLPQGCSAFNGYINFSIATDADECILHIYKKGESVPEYRFKLEKEDSVGNLRCLSVILDTPDNYEYHYILDGKYTLDPCSKAFHVTEEGTRSLIQLPAFDWEADTFPKIKRDETIAYSLHVKGFTNHWTSKVTHRGTFKGLLEKLDYLKELGVNQLHLMPVYEFDDMVQGKKNYWGYGNGYYFAPKADYAADNVVNEVKEMVKILHKNGIEVILEMPFTEGVCHNIMIDALRYWRMEYHIDGFILNPYTIDWRMVCTDPVLSGAKLLKKQDDFQNTMRSFIKSDSGMISSVMWWTKCVPEDGQTYNYITNQTGFTLEDLVSFNKKHNEDNGENNCDGCSYNYSWNCGEEGESKDADIIQFRMRQKKNALYTLFLSQGTPCLLAGDEFGNTQFGNNNPYCQDNEVTWLDWKGLLDNEELFTFVKALIKLRKTYRAFHPAVQLCGERSASYGIPELSYHGEDAWSVNYDEENRSFSIFYHVKHQVEEFVLVVYNMHWENHLLGVPNLPKEYNWFEAATTEEGILTEVRAVEKMNRIEVGPRTITVLIGK